MDATFGYRGFTVVTRALGEGSYLGSYEARPLDLQAEGPHLNGDAVGTFADAQAAEAAAAVFAKAAIDAVLD